MDLERIRNSFAEWPTAAIIQGAVPEILSTVEFDRIAFLHIDMNCAYPERAALQFFWDRLCPGAIVLLDGYAYLGHHSQRITIDDFARQVGTGVVSFPTGQGLIVR